MHLCHHYHLAQMTNPVKLVGRLQSPCSLPSQVLMVRRRIAMAAAPTAHRISKSSSSNNAYSRSSSSFSLVSSSGFPQITPAVVKATPSLSPRLALFSLLFVLSTAIGAIFSLFIISLPTINALRKLALSVSDLSKVVSEEVPGTLSSLKLSCLEINELTQQLSIIRQKISPTKSPPTMNTTDNSLP